MADYLLTLIYFDCHWKMSIDVKSQSLTDFCQTVIPFEQLTLKWLMFDVLVKSKPISKWLLAFFWRDPPFQNLYTPLVKLTYLLNSWDLNWLRPMCLKVQNRHPNSKCTYSCLLVTVVCPSIVSIQEDPHYCSIIVL